MRALPPYAALRVFASAAWLSLPALAAAQPVAVDPRLKVEVVADGLGSGIGALSSAFAFVDRNVLLAASRIDGKIRRFDLAPGQVASPGPVVADLHIIANNQADSQSEFGVQGICLHPAFAANRLVYLRYDKSLSPLTDTPEVSLLPADYPIPGVVERWTWDPNANAGSGGLAYQSTVRTINVWQRYHHGGPVAFLPDGSLVISNGDQRLNTNASINTWPEYNHEIGLLTRITDDGAIPADNPFVLSGAPAWSRHIYVYGLRNAFGLAIDPATGRLWFSDNGESTFDEVNLAFPGMNGGHARIAGPVSHPAQTGSTNDLVIIPGSSYADPVFSWRFTTGVTGLGFLYGSPLGRAWDDTLLVTTFNIGYVWGLRLNPARDNLVLQHPGLADHVDDRPSFAQNPVGTEAAELLFARNLGNIFQGAVNLTIGPDGLPYILTAHGKVYRITRSCWADLATAGDPDPFAGPDGFITGEDFDLFVMAYFTEHRRIPGGFLIADIATAGNSDPFSGPDGFITGEDFDAFVILYFKGC